MKNASNKADYGKSSVTHGDKRPTQKEAEEAVRTLLLWAGEDAGREGLLKTPERVVKAYNELFSGYGRSAEDVLGTVFEDVAGYNEPVIIRNVSFFSHCEHHMLPITGRVHVAYLPDGKVIGLSKIPRLVEIYARRLQTQETMTARIADALHTCLQPRGVAVLVEAEHLCMAMRGVHKPGANTITTAFRGEYGKNKRARADFMMMFQGRR